MFFTGILSGALPYILVSLFYFVCLISYCTAKKSADDDVIEIKEKVIKHVSKKQNTEFYSFYYNKSSQKKMSACKGFSGLQHSVKFSAFKSIKNKIKVRNNFFIYCLFSRPPPVL